MSDITNEDIAPEATVPVTEAAEQCESAPAEEPAAAEETAPAEEPAAAEEAAPVEEAAPAEEPDAAEQQPDAEEDDEEDDEDDDEEGEERVGGVLVEDMREHLNVVFIGHVDAGKSTLSGNLLYQTGVIDERTIAKYEREAKDKNRESWFYAYIMDTNEEERAKGKTVEVGRAHFETETKRYTILDAPGHKNYVPNMIGGAAQADIGILVISARRGEFETGFERGGQTCEHATLAKTLGVGRIIVAINKMDESTVGWAKERYDEIVTKMTKFLKSTGYNPKTDLHFLPVSGLSGANLTAKTRDGVADWYKGQSLLELLDDLPGVVRDENGPLRIPVLDKYKTRGSVFVMGKVESGTIERGMELSMNPGNQPCTVSSLELDTCEVHKARPGENVVVAVSGISADNIQQGFVLTDRANPIDAKYEFECQLYVMELLPHKPIMTAGYDAILHIHTAVCEVSITDLISVIDKKTKKASKRKPRVVRKGDYVTVRVEAQQSICVELFKNVQQLGRFTMRDEGKTIAIGKITKLPSDERF